MVKNKKPDFGTRIIFLPAHRGTEYGKTYQWAASVIYMYPEVIFINEDPSWFKNQKSIDVDLANILAHETIHQVLRNRFNMYVDYDRIRTKWVNRLKKKYTRKYAKFWDWMT